MKRAEQVCFSVCCFDSQNRKEISTYVCEVSKHICRFVPIYTITKRIRYIVKSTNEKAMLYIFEHKVQTNRYKQIKNKNEVLGFVVAKPMMAPIVYILAVRILCVFLSHHFLLLLLILQKLLLLLFSGLYK